MTPELRQIINDELKKNPNLQISYTFKGGNPNIKFKQFAENPIPSWAENIEILSKNN